MSYLSHDHFNWFCLTKGKIARTFALCGKRDTTKYFGSCATEWVVWDLDWISEPTILNFWIWSLCKNFGSNPIAKFPYPYTPLICTRHASCVICGLMRLSLWSHVLFWCVWYRLRSSRTCFYVDASDSLLFVRESPHDSAYLIGYSMLVEVFVASKSWCVRHILSFIGLL